MTYIFAPDRSTIDAWGTHKYCDVRNNKTRWSHFYIESSMEKFFGDIRHYKVPDTFVILKGLPIL